METVMTKLTMEDFDLGYGSERWVMYGKDRKFIARFKYGSPGACARHHVKAIIALMTKEELEESLADRSVDYASKRWVSSGTKSRPRIPSSHSLCPSRTATPTAPRRCFA